MSLNVYELARMNYLAYAAGDARPVPDIEEHHRRREAGVRQRQERTTEDREASNWRYYGKGVERWDNVRID